MLPLASHAGVFLTRGRYIAGRRELPGGRIVQLGLVDADAIDALSACKQNLSGTSMIEGSLRGDAAEPDRAGNGDAFAVGEPVVE